MIELVLGGVSSGKSAWAEARAARFSEVVYFATAWAGDEEMTRRIHHHRARRPRHWCLVEVGADLASALRRHDAEGRCLLVDGLGLWLARFVDDEARLAQAPQALLTALASLQASVILVSDEVGLGGVAMTPAGRRFADALGALNQALARRARRVVWVSAGLPLFLKGEADD